MSLFAPSQASAGDRDSARLSDDRWRRGLILFARILGGCLALIGAAIVLVDPYDSGRLLALVPPGIDDGNPRTATVSRARDPQFNSAIIGNSHIQLISPANLSSATGMSFVHLSVPGTGPREQMTILDWFRRNHTRPGVIVIGFDPNWCSTDPSLPLINPFPFGLYRGFAEFAANQLSGRALSLMRRRVLVAAGKLPRSDPAGYWDYEAGHEWNFRQGKANWGFVDLTPTASAIHFPAFDLLDRTLAALPEGTRVIAVLPPQFRSNLPAPGSPAAAELRGCKHEIVRRFSGVPRRALLDFLFDTPANRDATNFMDAEHIRAPIARGIERDIAAAIAATGR